MRENAPTSLILNISISLSELISQTTKKNEIKIAKIKSANQFPPETCIIIADSPPDPTEKPRGGVNPYNSYCDISVFVLSRKIILFPIS